MAGNRLKRILYSFKLSTKKRPGLFYYYLQQNFELAAIYEYELIKLDRKRTVSTFPASFQLSRFHTGARIFKARLS